ncbi:MAG: hypothetical protein A3D44_03655 [Candidatus Staskawiczbacteria bacterium RIFCSPHIGHO2_02_FULL_42_22]|uniref:STAS domain-containing protein n=1 Tax=Candidatus Staskawiczbacteria bacterium RIFCSPHIGHO2_02_FULL_42_22 TaxID=1802207 RepID=A0A1G2I4D4_9BACT|nr:MAG: hypothetical protein A3D44_03655 [Candidatus Staskawiczbacteria bacterium RIFCSPHIGHO2_02_FULL_42_22]
MAPPRFTECAFNGNVALVTLIFPDNQIMKKEDIDAMGRELVKLIDVGAHEMVVNFENIEYMSSAAIAKFIRIQRRISDRGGKLVLCQIPPQIYEVFEITRFHHLFKIVATQADALREF